MMHTKRRYDVEMAILMTDRARRGGDYRGEEEKGEGEVQEKEFSLVSKVVIKYPHMTSLVMVLCMLYAWFFVIPFQPYGPVVGFVLFTSILFTRAHKDRLRRLLHTQRGRQSIFLFVLFLVTMYALIRILGGTGGSIESSRFDDTSIENMNVRSEYESNLRGRGYSAPP